VGLSRLKVWASFTCLAALAACGGGGGGSGASAPPPPPPLAGALRITNVTPSSIAQDVREAANPMAGFEIGADLAGDLSRLTGETVYVLIEDARGLFELASTQISPNGLGNRVVLRLKSTLGLTGSLEGNLRLNVCLDTACTRPLGNSPVVLPYRINIVGGVRIAESGPIVVDVPFGEPSPLSGYVFAARRAVSLVIPANLSGLTAIPPFDSGWVTPSGGSGGDQLAGLSYGNVVPGQTIAGELAFFRRPVGSYVSRLKLSSSLESVAGAPVESVTEIRYIVRESAVTMAFDASQSSFVDSATQQFVNVTSAGGLLYGEVSRIVYSPNSGSVNWLQLLPSFSQIQPTSRLFEVFANKCQFSVGCLGSGSYTADVYFRTGAGVESPAAWRVTLQVL
jgi:hypothetical protein